jgi:transcriptional regulator with XRE-family HTH domain
MANRIRELREKAGLNQGELAKLMDADAGRISRWESGQRPLSPDAIERLAHIFKIGSWELFLDRNGLRQLVGRPNRRNRGDVADGEPTA